MSNYFEWLLSGSKSEFVEDSFGPKADMRQTHFYKSVGIPLSPFNLATAFFLGLAGCAESPSKKTEVPQIVQASRQPISTPSTSQTNYAVRIAQAIRPNLAYAESIVGNPSVEVRLKLSADGTIVERSLTKSSGVRELDQAVLHAIDRTKKLPLDVDGKAPPIIEIVWRLKD